MAEASFDVYISVIVLGILFGYGLFSLRQRNNNSLLPRPRSKQGFVYGLVGILMFMIGYYFVAAGALYMTLTEINLKYFVLPTPNLVLSDSKDQWIVNSTFAILEGVKKQSLEIKHSEGLAYLGIGIGLILAAIPVFLESWKIKNERNKTIDFLLADLVEINDKLATVIRVLKRTLTDLNGNANFVSNLIQHTTPPAVAIGTLTAGIRFARWELYATQLREFGLTDPKIINQLRGFIIEEFNRKIEPNEDAIYEQVLNILTSNNPNMFQQLRTMLLSALNDNLKQYQNLYNLFHRELDKISWISNQTWEKVGE